MRSKEELLVEGEYKPEEDKISVMLHKVSNELNLPDSILNYVEESKETLIYNDAFPKPGL